MTEQFGNIKQRNRSGAEYIKKAKSKCVLCKHFIDGWWCDAARKQYSQRIASLWIFDTKLCEGSKDND